MIIQTNHVEDYLITSVLHGNICGTDSCQLVEIQGKRSVISDSIAIDHNTADVIESRLAQINMQISSNRELDKPRTTINIDRCVLCKFMNNGQSIATLCTVESEVAFRINRRSKSTLHSRSINGFHC